MNLDTGQRIGKESRTHRTGLQSGVRIPHRKTWGTPLTSIT